MADKHYAGIGSRRAPAAVLHLASRIAQRLATHDFILRSGAADGMDSAFETGARADGGKCEIFIPARGFGRSPDAIVLPDTVMRRAQGIAASVHPAWHRCSDYA